MRRYYIFLGILISVVILTGIVWLLFFRNSSVLNVLRSGVFGSAPIQSVSTSIGTGTQTSQPLNVQNGVGVSSKVFKISDGPITGAYFIQTRNPTTTLARFMTQQDGHVFDIPLDVPGAILRPVSDTTVPGTIRSFWVNAGGAVIIQYLDTRVIKTAYINFQVGSTTSVSASRIQFLPDNITGIAVSPDGRSVGYLLPTAQGTQGYIAQADGSQIKNLFYLPLKELLISWPATSTLLVQTKSADNVPGLVFSINTKTGGSAQLVYGLGITATANRNFTKVLYQTRLGITNSYTSYVHTLSSGGDIALLQSVFPEKCAWPSISAITIFCADPTTHVDADFLDRWHRGTASSQDGIFSLDIRNGNIFTLAIPGSSDGGLPADIAQLIISPDDHYLMYITKGDRSLWAVRLTP